MQQLEIAGARSGDLETRAVAAIEAAPIFAGTLAEAEATLVSLRERQIAADAAETELAALDAATGPEAVADRLAAEGFGTRRQPAAAEILARINERVAIANRRSAPEPLSRALTAGALR